MKQWKPYRPSKWVFNQSTDKINYLAKVAAKLDKERAPKDPAWVFRALA